MAMQVRAACDWCGPITLPPEQIILMIYPDLPSRYVFVCPRCSESIVTDGTPDNVRLLQEAGVRPAFPSCRRTGDPLTVDELIDFGRGLEGGADPWTELSSKR